jgi:GNAT superfamily N-acetyltransferase
MEIAYLADHPHLIPVLADWHHQQWRHYNPGDTVAKRIGRMREQLGRRQIPTTFVALAGEAVMGSASLVAHDMHNRSNLTPWLASVYVAPEHRRQGVGSALVERVVQEARAIGVETLYLFTPDREAWYVALGWSVQERTEYMGAPAVIMTLHLPTVQVNVVPEN